MLRNDYYTTGNLLDYSYQQNCYKLIGIDLWTQTNTKINFTRKLEDDDSATMLFIAEKQQKITILSYSLDSLNARGKYKQCKIK